MRWIRSILGLLVLVGLCCFLYGAYMHTQLRKTLGKLQLDGGYSVRYDLVRGRYAKVATVSPVTVRAFVKATRAHNWTVTEANGLVHTVLQWSLQRGTWVIEPQETLPITQRVRLGAILREPTSVGLMEALMDEDRWTREVAFQELRLRAGEDFGYHPEATKADRAAAMARWRQSQKGVGEHP